MNFDKLKQERNNTWMQKLKDFPRIETSQDEKNWAMTLSADEFRKYINIKYDNVDFFRKHLFGK